MNKRITSRDSDNELETLLKRHPELAELSGTPQESGASFHRALQIGLIERERRKIMLDREIETLRTLSQQVPEDLPPECQEALIELLKSWERSATGLGNLYGQLRSVSGLREDPRGMPQMPAENPPGDSPG